MHSNPDKGTCAPKINPQLFNKLICVAGRENPISLHWAGKGRRSFQACLWRIPFCHCLLQQIKNSKIPTSPQGNSSRVLIPPAGTCSRAQVCEAGLSHQLSPEGTDSFCASLPGSCRESRGGWERGLLPNTPRDSISKAQKRAQDNRDTEQAPIGILTFPPACSYLF